MTPRRLDEESVGLKLRAMRRLLDELERLGAVDAARLAGEFGTQLIVERVVSQLVDLAAGINAHVCRLRNVLVHAYVDLDVDRLVAAVPLAVEQYGEYVRQVARWLADRTG